MNFGLRSAVCGPGFDICCKVTPNSAARDRLVWRNRARPMAASQRVEDQYSKEGPFENPYRFGTTRTQILLAFMRFTRRLKNISF
jgi:hypothetical protein